MLYYNYILFTTTFTAIIVVCSLKSMCIPGFVLIGSCVCEVHAPLCLIVAYGLRLLLFYKNYIVYRNFNMMLQWLSWEFYQCAKSHFLTLYSLEICELKLKKNNNNNKERGRIVPII